MGFFLHTLYGLNERVVNTVSIYLVYQLMLPPEGKAYESLFGIRRATYPGLMLPINQSYLLCDCMMTPST
jgi:hypothetical protein